MKFILVLLILSALTLLWLFYDKFTRRGAIPLDKAARDFTTWFGLLGIAFADWLVLLGQWLAGFWEPLQATIGPALASPGMEKFVMLWSALMLALKFKGQTPVPKPSLPDFPAAPTG